MLREVSLASGRDEEFGDSFGEVLFGSGPVVTKYRNGLGFRGVGQKPIVGQLMNDFAGGMYISKGQSRLTASKSC